MLNFYALIMGDGRIRKKGSAAILRTNEEIERSEKKWNDLMKRW